MPQGADQGDDPIKFYKELEKNANAELMVAMQGAAEQREVEWMANAEAGLCSFLSVFSISWRINHPKVVPRFVCIVAVAVAV